MILNKYVKQPDEVKDYDIDYSAWLAPMVDSISSTAVTINCLNDPLDTTLICDSFSYSADRVKLWMSGGTANKKYKVTVDTTTIGGRLDESELIFSIKDY